MKGTVWGVLPEGKEAKLYTLESEYVRLTVSSLGATVVGIWMPDRRGIWQDVVLGFDTPEEYLRQPGNLGAAIGRYAGRIANGAFPLNGQTVQLKRNRGAHTIHGGPEGFHRRLWTVTDYTRHLLELELVSPAGDQGFPGELTCRLRFLLEEDALTMEIRALSDADTVCSITSHAYWNLAGHDGGEIDGHMLSVAAERCLETDGETIPTGGYCSLEGTTLDLRQETSVRNVEADHTFVLSLWGGEPAACLREPVSGRQVEVYTDLPGLQVYTGDHLPCGMAGKAGTVYGPRRGLCLEPQCFPDSPNHPAFPDTVLRRGEELRHFIRWRFGLMDDEM